MSEVKKEKIRKVFIDDLPRWSKGGKAKEGTINWIRCEELKCEVRFIYDDIEGYVEIVGYKPNNQKLIIKYLDKEPFEIATSSFLKCQLGKLLGKYTSEFKAEIGQIFKDDKKDITIIDRKIKKDKNNTKYKHYRYKCNKCGWDESWISEGDLLVERGCPACSNYTQIIVPHINSIVANEETHWMIKYFQGGYEEAKMYTPKSNQKIRPICPDCGRVKDKEIYISNIYYGKSIGCNCSDGKSYPEKFMNMVLEYLGLSFKNQLSKSDFEWCEKYKYDFYFEYNEDQYIIETHGGQHPNTKYYDSGFAKSGRKTYEQELQNDNIKKELVLANGIKEDNYIVIDCSLSDMNFIKGEILDSNLNKLFDLSIVEWNKCEEFALKNRVREACEIKNNNHEMSCKEIGDIMKLSDSTVCRYLKKGSLLNWCDYNPKEEKLKGINKGKKIIKKKVEIYKADKSLGVFSSVTELDSQSEKLFGIKLDFRNISAVCLGKRKTYKGFTFKYIS